MFVTAVNQVKEAIYGVKATTQQGNQVQVTTGSGFMISPGYIVTCSHVIHQQGIATNPRHQTFHVIRAPDIGGRSISTSVFAENVAQDLAILHLEKAPNTTSLTLANNVQPIGTEIGSAGFPLSTVGPTGHWTIDFRFQSAYISAHIPQRGVLEAYETDGLMYPGSSGCPGFTDNSTVWGMHQKVRLEGPLPPPGSSGVQTPNRVAISLWLPSINIRNFATANGISI